MENTGNELDTVEVEGITYEVLERKPVTDKKFQFHLYIKHGSKKFIVTQFGRNYFSKVHPLTNENELPKQ